MPVLGPVQLVHKHMPLDRNTETAGFVAVYASRGKHLAAFAFSNLHWLGVMPINSRQRIKADLTVFTWSNATCTELGHTIKRKRRPHRWLSRDARTHTHTAHTHAHTHTHTNTNKRTETHTSNVGQAQTGEKTRYLISELTAARLQPSPPEIPFCCHQCEWYLGNRTQAKISLAHFSGRTRCYCCCCCCCCYYYYYYYHHHRYLVPSMITRDVSHTYSKQVSFQTYVSLQKNIKQVANLFTCVLTGLQRMGWGRGSAWKLDCFSLFQNNKVVPFHDS